MGKIKKILIVITVLFICFIGLVFGSVILISIPTGGDEIEQYKNPQKALFVIDIQEDFTGITAKPPFPYKDSGKLIATVNTITEAASRENIIIVYIRQELDGLWYTMLSKLLVGEQLLKEIRELR